MRRLILFSLVAFLILPLAACQKEQEDEEILIAERSFFSNSSSAISFKTTFTAKTDWSVSTHYNWITITSPTEGVAGKHTLTFNAARFMSSPGVYYREGQIILQSTNKRYYITVEQGRKTNYSHGQSNM